MIETILDLPEHDYEEATKEVMRIRGSEKFDFRLHPSEAFMLVMLLLRGAPYVALNYPTRCHLIEVTKLLIDAFPSDTVMHRTMMVAYQSYIVSVDDANKPEKDSSILVP